VFVGVPATDSRITFTGSRQTKKSYESIINNPVIISVFTIAWATKASVFHTR
jgi:hypothetical protein